MIAPSIRDPRMHLAAVIVSLHVLGQVALDFDVSIAQILLCVGVAALVGFVTGMVRDRTIAWPASSVLAGNGTAFVLRIPGTEHGDWWSLRGWWIYVIAVLLGLASKAALRWNGRHLFNPSNFGLVVTFLVLGSSRADPLPFWWGPLSGPTIAALAVIAVGGVALVLRLRIATIVVSFWCSFAAGLAVVAGNDHCMIAPWKLGPACGPSFWWTLATSPEVLVFMFFMITDPRTSPTGRVARVVYGTSIGLGAALLVAPQSTEFASKVAILSALTIVCGLRPWIERRLPAAGSTDDRFAWFVPSAKRSDPRAISWRWTALVPAIVILLVLAAPTTVDDPGILADRPAPLARPSYGSELALPDVRFDESNEVSAHLDDALLRRIARDVAEDFAIIAEAQEAGDDELLATAVAESQLVERRDAMAAQQGVVERITPVRLIVSVARRPGQSAPATLVTVDGTMARATSVRPFHETFEIKLDGDHYVLTTDQPPAGFVEPVTASAG